MKKLRGLWFFIIFLQVLPKIIGDNCSIASQERNGFPYIVNSKWRRYQRTLSFLLWLGRAVNSLSE